MPRPSDVPADWTPEEWSWHNTLDNSVTFFTWSSFPFEYTQGVANETIIPILAFDRDLSPLDMPGLRKFPLGPRDWTPIEGISDQALVGNAIMGIRSLSKIADPSTGNIEHYEEVPGWGNDFRVCVRKGEEQGHWLLKDRATQMWYVRQWAYFPFVYPYEMREPTDGVPNVAVTRCEKTDRVQNREPRLSLTLQTNPHTLDIYRIESDQERGVITVLFTHAQVEENRAATGEIAARADTDADRARFLPAGDDGKSVNVDGQYAKIPECPTNSPLRPPTPGGP
jgi:hypothetical protein